MITQEQLTYDDFHYINAVLMNDEYSSDEEMIDWFQKKLDISKELAERMVSFRVTARHDLFFDIEDYLELID